MRFLLIAFLALAAVKSSASDSQENPEIELPPSAAAAASALEAGNYALAESLGRDMLSRSSSDPVGWRIVALSLFQKGDIPGATAAVENGLAQAPLDDGLIGLKNILKSKSGVRFLDTRGAKGQFSQNKNIDEALKAKRAPSSEMGSAAPPPKMLPAELAENAKPMAFLKPERYSGFTRRGLEEMQGGDLIAAIKEFNKALRQNPEDSAALRWRALAREKAGDHEGALKDADRALAVEPRDAWAQKTRALALLALGRASEALAAASLAIELNATDGDAYRTRALVQKALGDKDALISDLSQAAALDPTFAALYQAELSRIEKKPAAANEENPAEGDPAKSAGTALALLAAAAIVATLFSRGRG